MFTIILLVIKIELTLELKLPFELIPHGTLRLEVKVSCEVL